VLKKYDRRVQIGMLKNLKQLHLAYNRLTDVPREIVSLASLEELSLNQNRARVISCAVAIGDCESGCPERP
jgi:Leucine-rich repeat (LRR) protein